MEDAAGVGTVRTVPQAELDKDCPDCAALAIWLHEEQMKSMFHTGRLHPNWEVSVKTFNLASF